MSTTRLALVRHGRTDWNRRGLLQGSTDVPLDEVGREQAQGAARLLDFLDPIGWDTVVSSPLSRAYTTGRIVAAHLCIGMPGTIPDLAERTYGDAEGSTREDAELRWPGGDFPGLEPLEEVAARGVRALDVTAAMHPGCRIVVVSHGALIRAVLDQLSPEPAPRIVNGAVSELEWSDRWVVRSVNRTVAPDPNTRAVRVSSAER
ncbi:histidine phosphatase family protein [Rhodococcus pyridinivorans]|uniref:histidine phosphatase family protein n=1 Tax=Rhodococcus pyridinivorans TaxID=103816 RepID=UPI001E56D859|nr:histidine phosphatase family protein [Rhodococcus pyridinivorans]MCD5418138.1 histidine phosphatase family protein [Rhodococcus pyridinivorans]